jgi:hypothetical protein
LKARRFFCPERSILGQSTSILATALATIVFC